MRCACVGGTGLRLATSMGVAKLFGGEHDKAAVADRLPGSLALALHGAAKGYAWLPAHDVAETVQALDTWGAMRG